MNPQSAHAANLARYRLLAGLSDALHCFRETLDEFCGGRGSKRPGPCPHDKPHVEARARAAAARTRAEHHSRRLAEAVKRHEAGNGTRGSATAIDRHRVAHAAAKAEAERHEQRARRLEAAHHREQQIRKHDPDIIHAVKEGRRAGIRPEALHREAAQMMALDREHKDGLKTMLQDARQHALALGSNLSTVRARNARGIDPDAVKRLDDVAMSMASAYPEFFPRGVDPEEHLFDLLSRGNPRPMSRGEAYEKALDRMMREKMKQKREVAEVPFRERRAKRH